MPIGPAPDWQDVTWMVGQYAGTPIVIAVDADGKIINVMQATYAGVLKPVACDAEGRIIMIPTDPADVWGNAISMGNAELAACLTPAKRFDRRGSVIWHTDFEYGLQGSTITVDDAASTYALTTSRANGGAFSLKLDPRGAADAYAEWSRVLAMTTPKKVGLSTAISIDTSPYLLEWSMIYRDGTNYHWGNLRYDPATGDWSVEYPAGTWNEVLSGYYLQQGSGAWHEVKWVVDFVNNKYLRLLVGDNEVNLTDYALIVSETAVLARVEMRFYVWGSVTKSEAGFLDSIFITQNEPS